MHASRSSDRTTFPVVKTTVWLVVAIAAYPVILFGGLAPTISWLIGNDIQTLGDILSGVGVLMSIGAGVYAYVLGGRIWAAALTGLPGVAAFLALTLQEEWLLVVFLVSPLAVIAGIVAVAAAPRRPSLASAAAPEPGEPGRPKPDRVERWLSNDKSTPGPELSALAPGERSWIDGCLERVAELGCDIDDLEQVRSLYERSVAEWHAREPGHRKDPSATINLIGAAFGEHLVRATPLRWVVATDEYGVSELAVNDAPTKTLVYPATEVAKAWVAGDSGEFLTEIPRPKAAG